MSDTQALFMGLVHTVQGVGESAFAIVSSAWGVVYTFVRGLVVLLWDTLESFAGFLGASVNFVICRCDGWYHGGATIADASIANILLLVVLAVGFAVYRGRAAGKPAAAARRGKKKAE
ncbi:uncharacterized protein LOC62_01G000282 [Vanrija pseudolonga]|uniref:Uncharacterized protein n=1 Tax=Vanrija pseudolonga TaxID=143232 RepID=A0AAF0Y4P7_9TREE|nr:hypothetical protein LOC62_01G000282 [Vanrija pseudolonga]